MEGLDLESVATVTAAIFIAIACSVLAFRVGYNVAARDARGQFRQSFQVVISQIRADRTQDSDRAADERDNGG